MLKGKKKSVHLLLPKHSLCYWPQICNITSRKDLKIHCLIFRHTKIDCSLTVHQGWLKRKHIGLHFKKNLPHCFHIQPSGGRTPQPCSSCQWVTTVDGWTPRWRGSPGESEDFLPGWKSERPSDRIHLHAPHHSTKLVERDKAQRTSI